MVKFAIDITVRELSPSQFQIPDAFLNNTDKLLEKRDFTQTAVMVGTIVTLAITGYLLGNWFCPKDQPEDKSWLNRKNVTLGLTSLFLIPMYLGILARGVWEKNVNAQQNNYWKSFYTAIGFATGLVFTSIPIVGSVIGYHLGRHVAGSHGTNK